MKPIALAGIVLIVCGVVAPAYQGVTYRSRDTVLDLGPLHATTVREHTLALSPIVGLVATVAGVGLLVAGVRQKV